MCKRKMESQQRQVTGHVLSRVSASWTAGSPEMLIAADAALIVSVPMFPRPFLPSMTPTIDPRIHLHVLRA
jgi:hypothetical protein